MLNRLINLFKPGPQITPDQQREAEQRWYDQKSELMEQILGKEHDIVMHAIIPFCIGGALDLYYYPHKLPGVAIATKELSDLPNVGSKNRDYSTYELVMFIRPTLVLENASDTSTPFGKAHTNVTSILNPIARYSQSAILNEFETCEFPKEMERIGGKCMIFAGAGLRTLSTGETFGVLTVVEIFRSEMVFARAHSGGELIELLVSAKHFPYSDLDREPVA